MFGRSRPTPRTLISGRYLLPLVCLLALTSLAGCDLGLPTQNNPSCSWNITPPSHSATICRIAFGTLKSIVRAEVAGDNRPIRRLVANPRVARKVIAYGDQQRLQGLKFMHVVPSLTLDITSQGLVGAGFFIVGKTRGGRIADPQTVYMRLHGGTAQVTEDQPDQQW